MSAETGWVDASAPSNIALIKYMGKTADPSANVSANSSLSWTLDHLRTFVRVRWEDGGGELEWRPLVREGLHAPALSEKGKARYLKHAERCLERLSPGTRNKRNTFIVESANGFPSDCGLASSASSFAALTLAIATHAGVDTSSVEQRKMLASLSREGSGSSCRSLFSPWAIWTNEGASPVEGLPVREQIRHLSLIVDDSKKMVSSSEAHVRVTTSSLFRGRIERAEERLRLLLDLLRRAGGSGGTLSWNRAAHIVWAESWDMHALFETSEPPFGYFVPGSIVALTALRSVAERVSKDGGREPIVTMDAGPNVHVLLWKDDRTDDIVQEMRKTLSTSIRILDSERMSK